MQQAVHAFASLRVPLCAIDLAPAGHRVADTRASARVHVLDHDEGMLLQRGHCQVTVIRHLLQEAAVSRPDGVAHLKDPASERTHLESKKNKKLACADQEEEGWKMKEEQSSLMHVEES